MVGTLELMIRIITHSLHLKLAFSGIIALNRHRYSVWEKFSAPLYRERQMGLFCQSLGVMRLPWLSDHHRLTAQT